MIAPKRLRMYMGKVLGVRVMRGVIVLPIALNGNVYVASEYVVKNVLSARFVIRIFFEFAGSHPRHVQRFVRKNWPGVVSEIL